jgi:hypothetical protein
MLNDTVDGNRNQLSHSTPTPSGTEQTPKYISKQRHSVWQSVDISLFLLLLL